MIIVIDDDQTVANALEMLLKMSGYDVITAETAEIGLGLMSDMMPNLIICDYKLPMMNGLEFASHLEISYPEKDIPILLTTGADISQLENVPCTVTLIQKPFDVSQILSTIAEQLEGSVFP